MDNGMQRRSMRLTMTSTKQLGTKVLNHVLESKVPKNIPKSKKKRNVQQPDGIKRHNPLSDEWMDIFRTRETAKESKQATRRSGRKRVGK